MQEIEKWQPINGAEKLKISNFGNVMGVKGGPYKTPPNRKGYPMVRASQYRFCKVVHSLVAEQFIGPRPTGAQVNHIDGNKLNNRWDNLEYISCKENIHHAIKTGLRKADQNLRSNDMFDKIQIQVIRDCFTAGWGNQEISRYFKCNHSTISKIRTGAHYPVR